MEVNNNTIVDLKASASAMFGAVVVGEIELGNAGLAFYYGKQYGGSVLLFAWSEIGLVEVNIGLRGKLKKDFAIVSRGNIFRFKSDEVGEILKITREKIGSGKMTRVRNLFSPFVIFGK